LGRERDDASVVGPQIADWIEVNIHAVDEKCLKSAIQRSAAVGKKRTGQHLALCLCRCDRSGRRPAACARRRSRHADRPCSARPRL